MNRQEKEDQAQIEYLRRWKKETKEMTNENLIEYLEMFGKDSGVSIIVANPKDRKIYKPEKAIMIVPEDEEEKEGPAICIEVGPPRDMDEEELKMTMDDEREAQPELPRLKNNDQRKEFLKTYRDWLVWFEVPQAEETYYRYILPDGSAIVICEYKKRNDWWANKYIDKNPETTGTVEYLLEPRHGHLHDCRTNETALIRKLMEVQKK